MRRDDLDRIAALHAATVRHARSCEDGIHCADPFSAEMLADDAATARADAAALAAILREMGGEVHIQNPLQLSLLSDGVEA